MKKWKKSFILVYLAILVLSLCACTSTSNETVSQEVNEESDAATVTPEPSQGIVEEESASEIIVEDNDDDMKTSEEGNETSSTTSEVKEETVSDGVKDDSIFSKPIAPVSYIAVDDPKAKYLVQNVNNMRRWQMGFQTISTTFPSTKELSEDRCIQLSNADELNAYFEEYNDIWVESKDELTATCKKYVYEHDWFYDQEIKSSEGNLQYYIIENPGFYSLSHYEVDETNIYYDEETKTVYITLFMGFNYEEYLNKFNKSMAEKVKAEVKSNRMLLVVKFPDEEIDEIVIVKPRDWK